MNVCKIDQEVRGGGGVFKMWEIYLGAMPGVLSAYPISENCQNCTIHFKAYLVDFGTQICRKMFHFIDQIMLIWVRWHVYS